MPIIELRRVTYTYPGSNKPAIRNVDLVIEPGEYVVITGPSGCGKTTLCRCLNGLIPHFYGGELEGEVYVSGMSVKSTPTSKLAQIVGMVFQDPESQLFLLTVEREVAFGPENLGLPRGEVRARVEEALNLVGIAHLRDRSPHELSGGEQQKVAIAACLSMKPKILVLDEPTANLDPESALHVLSLLSDLKNRLGVTIVLVEHRLEAVAPSADRVIVMDKGEVILDGAPREVLSKQVVEAIGIGVPKVVKLYNELRKYGVDFKFIPLSPSEVRKAILEVMRSDRSS
ncbi:MAG: ABC transporter ATP-binding protein [Candidatus Methanomethylicota archaeon]|uniref:ABC transporter ATP-binding protein n=1 Tax=Thermoproteota archaeon TaxID=2056631 RepID=A0A497EVC1_9CREN|nr:MAG: ABC transporter ATP-binding protein [Candidatus Verstraetearchaeota archaeon]RLE54111.1 MAG: ABC transporter ATP-binding protein [Candidatus Verstraetearchaeota archaeon]